MLFYISFFLFTGELIGCVSRCFRKGSCILSISGLISTQGSMQSNIMVKLHVILAVYNNKQVLSTKMSTTGYKKSRFPTLQGQIFDCHICLNVVKAPKQCTGCGNLFCGKCIDDYSKIHGSCPKSCNSTISPMNRISCLTCSKAFKMENIEKHESECGRSKCRYFQSCAGYLHKNGDAFCSEKCSFVNSLAECQGDEKKLYNLLKAKLQKGEPIESQPGRLSIKWNSRQCWMNVVVNQDGTAVFLKQDGYVFRTIFALTPFTSGRHYWQIHPDSRTQNEIKIGVTSSTNFNLNTAFCDHPFGFAFYGLGQLRNGSNAAGSYYGKRFKKTGVLGIFLNMDKGELSFSLNGEDFGIAYKNQQLSKGPVYPAVALLHCSGCTIKGELPIPQLYQNK